MPDTATIYIYIYTALEGAPVSVLYREHSVVVLGDHSERRNRTAVHSLCEPLYLVLYTQSKSILWPGQSASRLQSPTRLLGYLRTRSQGNISTLIFMTPILGALYREHSFIAHVHKVLRPCALYKGCAQRPYEPEPARQDLLCQGCKDECLTL